MNINVGNVVAPLFFLSFGKLRGEDKDCGLSSGTREDDDY